MKTQWHRRFHAGMAVFFAVQIPALVALFFYDRKLFTEVTLLYIAVLSLWALVAAHWGAFEAAGD